MKTSAFFNHLQTSLKTLMFTPTEKLFGNDVFIVPTFPAMQINLFPARTCFIIDTGAYPHEFNPRIQYQSFTIGFFAEDVTDPFGECCVKLSTQVDEILHKHMIELTSLNSEKVLIRLNRKIIGTIIKNNFPLSVRFWLYDTLTEL